MILNKIKKVVSRSHIRSGVNTNLVTILFESFGYTYPTSDNDNQIKIDLVLQEGKTAPKSSAFIRLISPLTQPFLLDNISLNINEDLSTLRQDSQIIIVQRAVLASLEEALDLTKLANIKKVKLVVDTDDAFFSLDKNHPNYDELHNRHDALLHLIKSADQLWVSTSNLKKYYQKICKTPIHIMPNTLDSRVWQKNNIKKMPGESPLKILYMGTATHGEDFQMIVPWLDKLYGKYPASFELHIVGVASELPKKDWIKPIKREFSTVIYPNFVKWIQSKGPFDIGLAPLVDSEFNKYKSDIKCLDYLAIGAIPMVSDVDPYSTKSLDNFIIRNPNIENAWVESLEEILLDLPKFRGKRLKILSQGQSYIWEKRSSDVSAKRIAELLKIN